MAEEKIKIIIVGDSSSAKKAINELGKSFTDTESKLKRVGQTMTSIGTKMSIAVTAPLVLIGKKSLEMAVDVVESENLFTVSLGKMADAATEWSKEFSSAVGLNEYEVRKQIGTFDVMLKSMGLTEEAAYDMSKSFTELAYDMASFYNLKPEEAFDKLKSGIVGMPRPLQDLGIVVNETAVKMYALKQGIIEQGQEMNETQKIMARYGAIMERTSAAQGDMARTIESPANQMRIFKEQVNLAMIELGEGLIPIVLKAINAIKPYIESFTNASDSTKQLIITIGLIAAGIGPALIFIGQMIKAIGSLRNAYISLNAATLSFISKGSVLAGVFRGLTFALQNFAAVGIPAFDLFLEQIGLYKAASGELVHITHYMTGEMLKFQFTFGLVGEEAGGAADKIQELAQIISTEMPEVQNKAMNLFQSYKDGTITIEEFKKGLEDVIKQVGWGVDIQGNYIKVIDDTESSVGKAKLSVDAYRQSLIDSGTTVEKANELTKDYADSLGYAVDEEGNLEEAANGAARAIDEQTSAVEEARKALDLLYDSLFNQYLLNADISEGLKEAISRYDEYTQAVEKRGEGSDEANEKEEEWIRTLDMLTSTKIPDLINKVGLLTDEEADHLMVIKDQIDKAHELGIVSDEEWTNISRSINQKIMGSIVPDYTYMYNQGQIISDQVIEPEIKVDTGPATTALAGLKNLLDQIQSKSITITTSYAYSTIAPPGGAMGGNKEEASGGMIGRNLFAPDLNIPLYKGEAVLPAYLVKAIKEGKGSFAGLGQNANDNKPIQVTVPVDVTLDGEIIYRKTSTYQYDQSQTKGRLG